MIGIAGHPNCSYQSFLLLPESLSKSSKVTARHKSHFRDARCRWASSLCKNVTFHSQKIITRETRAGKAGPITVKPRVVLPDIPATHWAKKQAKKTKTKHGLLLRVDCFFIQMTRACSHWFPCINQRIANTHIENNFLFTPLILWSF